MCISNDKADFEAEMKSMPNAEVNRINSHLDLEGFGKVKWTTLDTNRKLQTFKPPACCASKARQKLSSTSTFCKTHPNNKIEITPKLWTMKQNKKAKDKADVEAMTSPVNTIFK